MAFRVVLWVLVLALGASAQSPGGDLASPIADIAAELAKPHVHTVEQRRAALIAIGAIVPDDKGKFPTKPSKEGETLDWLAALQTATDPAAVEVRADIERIAKLAASRDQAAAEILLQVGFSPETMIYRDEIGRALRKMAPYSLVGLVASTRSANADLARYAGYQLERLDRQDPKKAIAAAAIDPTLRASVIRALGTSGNRDAVPVIWQLTNSEDPTVRGAARDAWMAYVSGPPPPPAPKQYLKLPGGKLTKDKQPLWLTYRELAGIELRRDALEVFGEEAPPKTPLDELTKRFFTKFDTERAARLQTDMQALLAKAASPEAALAAAEKLELLLGQNSQLAAPPELPQIFADNANAQMKASQWVSAAANFAKAAAFETDPGKAKRYQAAHHVALGKQLESQGKSGEVEYALALRLDDGFAPAQKAYAAATGQANRGLLLAGGAALALAIVAFAIAWRRRA